MTFGGGTVTHGPGETCPVGRGIVEEVIDELERVLALASTERLSSTDVARARRTITRASGLLGRSGQWYTGQEEID